MTTEPSSLLPLCVSLPFCAAVLVALVGRRALAACGWLVLTAALGSFASLALAAAAKSPIGFAAEWLPDLGISFALRADGFGLLLGFLVAGIGALVALYSTSYIADDDPEKVRRFYAALAVFMGSMLGIALADDLILLFVFWELTSISSFLLIGYRSEDAAAKAGALTALQVTALGGLAMVVGFLLIGQVTGTFSLSAITRDPARISALLASPLSSAALLLVLLGAFTKSAQVPFHFWLPRAMVAPTPVSTYLHAATMVKAGVFLLGRMHPLFGDAPLWTPILVVVGGASAILGAYQALGEVDLKAILARTTASVLGLITLLFGIGATADASLHMLSHALYKGALFLIAGIVEHHAHTRRIDELGGLRHSLPIPFLACALAAASMAGLPPLLGFVAKDSTFAVLLGVAALASQPLLQWATVLAILATSVLLVATAGQLAIGVFLGPERPSAHHADSHHGLPLWPAPLILALTALGLGLASAGHLTSELVVASAVDATGEVHVSLFPPLGWPLLLSALALLLGALLYARRDAFKAWQRRASFLPGGAAVWESLMAGIVHVADALSRRWQNGSLRWYLGVTAMTLPALCFYALAGGGLSWRHVSTSFAQMPWYGFLFCLLLIVATIAAVRATTRLAAAIATTTIGFLVAMLFVVYRSPDILLTQVLIETVATIFLLLVLVFLPPFPRRDLSAPAQLLQGAIAGAFGLTITLLILLAMTPGLRETDNISVRPGGLLSLALAEGGGQNAVNVIIVDIRALDTTGEITVVMVVGLCVYGVLRSRRRARAAAETSGAGGGATT